MADKTDSDYPEICNKNKGSEVRTAKYSLWHRVTDIILSDRIGEQPLIGEGPLLIFDISA